MVFSRFLEVDINTGVIIGMIIVLFYAVLGGMKGITYTQVAQYCVLIFAFMVPAIFIFYSDDRKSYSTIRLGGELVDEPGIYLLDKLDGLSTDLGFAEYTEGSKSLIDVFAITLALMVGTAGYTCDCTFFYCKGVLKMPEISWNCITTYCCFIYHGTSSSCICKN